jgi:phosphatidylinositol alpha-mannosyltransferase
MLRGRTIRHGEGAILAALVGLGLAAVAISRLGLHNVVHALVGVHLGWLALAAALMVLSLLMRAVSWLVVLRAALPGAGVPAPVVVRATMIGVMVSAVVPGRLGEPSRAFVVARRVGDLRRCFSVVLGTIFAQTLVNIVALTGLAIAALASLAVLRGHADAFAALALPLAIAAALVGAPRVLRRGDSARSARVRRVIGRVRRELEAARSGLRMFVRPRAAAPAIGFQLAAWGVQMMAAYTVIIAFGLDDRAGVAAAAAILLAVNVTAVVPITPSNVGVFQAATIAVLAAYGIGAGRGFAYGVALQAVEVITAILLGLPALAAEGLSLGALRRGLHSLRG